MFQLALVPIEKYGQLFVFMNVSFDALTNQILQFALKEQTGVKNNFSEDVLHLRVDEHDQLNFEHR